MCVGAPDSVLAEAASMKPRPSFASSLLTAEPTARLLWWPERAHLQATMMARLKWLVQVAAGQAWLIIDPREEESPTEDAVREAAEFGGLRPGQSVTLGSEVAVPVQV